MHSFVDQETPYSLVSPAFPFDVHILTAKTTDTVKAAKVYVAGIGSSPVAAVWLVRIFEGPVTVRPAGAGGSGTVELDRVEDAASLSSSLLRQL